MAGLLEKDYALGTRAEVPWLHFLANLLIVTIALCHLPQQIIDNFIMLRSNQESRKPGQDSSPDLKDTLTGVSFEQDPLNTALCHIRALGQDKPLGYLPVITIENRGSSLSTEIEVASASGFEWLHCRNGYCDFLYVYDSNHLTAHLAAHQELLNEFNVPIAPNEFVKWIFTHNAPPYSPLFDLIADAFGDKHNSLRSDSTAPRSDQFSSQIERTKLPFHFRDSLMPKTF